MVIPRQKMRSKPDKTGEVMAALVAIIAPARATEGVIKLDIARDLLDPDSFVATGIYEDGAALERQESAPEVHRAMAMFTETLAAPPSERSMTRRSTRRSSELRRPRGTTSRRTSSRRRRGPSLASALPHRGARRSAGMSSGSR